MGAEHRNSRKRNLACQSVATEAMVKPKRPFRAEGRNASVWRYSIAISLILLVAALVLLGYNRNSSAQWREQDAVDREFRVFGYKIVEEYPHDPDAFTQVREHFFLETYADNAVKLLKHLQFSTYDRRVENRLSAS